MLLPGRRGLIQPTPNVLFPVGEILAIALAGVRRITTAVTTLVPPVRLALRRIGFLTGGVVRTLLGL